MPPTVNDTHLKKHSKLDIGRPEVVLARLRGDGLVARCLRSGAVLSCGTFVAKLFGFGSKMLLTRLLLPQDMGLAVMVLSMTQLFDVLTEVGVKQSVIQHRSGAEPEYLNMAWWFQVVRGVGLYSAAFFAAPWLCAFYFQANVEVLSHHSMSEIIWLIRVSFMTLMFNVLLSPKAYVLEKTLRFGKVVLIVQGGLVLGTVTTIALAFALRNAWAIAIGFTSGAFFRCLLSYVLCPYMPRLQYDGESFQSLCRFARGMVGLPLITYIGYHADILVAGKLVATSAIGYYGMARVFAAIPRDLAAQIVNPVLTSAIATKQDDMVSLRGAVLRLTRLTSVMLLPSLVVAVFCGRTVLALVFGPEYAAASTAFSLCYMNTVLLVQGAIFVSFYFGTGHPARNRRFLALRALILGILVYPAVQVLGIAGAAAAASLASLTCLCVQVSASRRVLKFRAIDYVLSWVPGLLAASPILVLFLILHVVQPGGQILRLTMGAAGAVLGSLITLSLRSWRGASWHVTR